MTLTIPPEFQGKASVDVPVAGRVGFGLGRNASYAAAARGEIPTVRIGKKIRVPVAQLLRQLGYEI